MRISDLPYEKMRPIPPARPVEYLRILLSISFHGARELPLSSQVYPVE